MESIDRFLAIQFHALSRPAKLLLLALFLDGLLFSGFSLFFNLYVIDAGFSRDFLGMVNTAPSLSALLLGVPMGLIQQRWGFSPLFVSTAVLYGLAIGITWMFFGPKASLNRATAPHQSRV